MPRDTVPLHVRVSREQRQAALEHLGYEDYPDYINSPHWREVRARFRNSDRPQTCICGADGVLLHHKTYQRLGAEHLDDLVALCAKCHDMVHRLKDRGEFVDYSNFTSLERANQYFDQNREMKRRAEEEAPPSLEERVALKRRERSKARRKRKGKPSLMQKVPPRATINAWDSRYRVPKKHDKAA